MWRRLRNIFNSFRTYADLSPDLRMRQRVNSSLHNRPALTAEQWFEQCWRSFDIAPSIAAFVYEYLPQYSGIEFARVRPSDRLDEDLHLPLVCWFDWQTSFCEDFWARFGIDLSDRFDAQSYPTVEALVVFLNQQLSVNHSSVGKIDHEL